MVSVRVRSLVMQYADGSLHKTRSTRMCVCVCEILNVKGIFQVNQVKWNKYVSQLILLITKFNHNFL